MTDDKRNRGKGGQPQQGQFGQSQFGQTMQPDRQQSQQGRIDETDSQQNIRGEGSGSNQQAQQAHTDRMHRLHSSQRTGGLGEAGVEDQQQQQRPSSTVPRVPRQRQSQATQEVNADREQHVSGRNLGSAAQMGQQGGVSESTDRGAMQQTSLPSGTKSHRTWTQMSGGQQATQTSLEGGQWPAQAQGQSEGQNQGEVQPQQQEPSQSHGPGQAQQQGARRWQDPEQMMNKRNDQQQNQQNQQNQSRPQGQSQERNQSGQLQQDQPEVSTSTDDVREQVRQDAWERHDSQGWHPEEGSHQQHMAGSQGGIEDAGTRRQQNQDARSQASGEMLEQSQGLRGETDDAASVRQRSLGQHAASLEQQQRQGGAGGQDPDRQPGSGGQRAEAVSDRMDRGDDGSGKSGGRRRG